MTTDTRTQGAELVHPLTGEVLEPAATATTDLAEALEDLAGVYERLHAYRQAIIDELTARMDRGNARTEIVGPWRLTTNAPTSDVYDLVRLRVELEELVKADVLDADVVDRVIVTPDPVAPPAKLARVELNKLKRHPDARVLRALGAARGVIPQRRTLNAERLQGTA